MVGELLIKTSSVEALPELATYFAALPRDESRPEMNRARRFSQYADTGEVFGRLPHRPYKKSAENERPYDPLPEAIDQEPAFQAMLRDFASAFDLGGADDSVIDVHAIRVVARRGVPGLPTTQFHKDNAHGVAVYCVAREGVRGASTVLRRSATQPDVHRAELTPGQALLWDDRELVHYTTPLRGAGHRDVFVVTYKRVTPSFNRLYGLFLRTPAAAHLTGKIAMREAAERSGLRVPKLLAGPLLLEQIVEPDADQIVIKPMSGCMSAGVMPLVRAGDEWRNPWMASRRPWGRWIMAANARWPALAKSKWIVEEMIGKGKPPYDWKFHVVKGEVQIVSQFRRDGQTRWAKVWSRDFEPLGDVLPDRARTDTRKDDESLPPPRFGADLVAAAEELAGFLGLEFVRIDLYEDDAGPVFGEITQRPVNVRFVSWLDRKMGAAWLARK